MAENIHEIVSEDDVRDSSPTTRTWTCAGMSARTYTFSGGMRNGVRMVELDNGRLRLAVSPTRGMGIWRGWCGDACRLGWDSPVRGPVHPAYVPLQDPSGLGWLDGFDEWLVRCGLLSNGAPDFDAIGRLRAPLHGHIANRPAHRVTLAIDEDAGIMRLRGVVDESRFHFRKLRLTTTLTVHADQPHFELADEITNISGSPIDFQLLYHINFGTPILGEGSQFVAPVERVMPRTEQAAQSMNRWTSYRGPQAGTPEQVYFSKLLGNEQQQTQVLLVNPDATLAAYLSYRIDQLPCFTLWKNETDARDGYVTGLEPGTNFPNNRSFEASRQRTVPLQPNESHSVELTLGVAQGEQQVRQRMAEIQELQQTRAAIIEKHPQIDWATPE